MRRLLELALGLGLTVTPQLQPGPPARPVDRQLASQQLRLIRDELPKVRAAAVAWRNGVAGLLALLIGFGLIRGRSDISELAPRAAVVVGVLLFLSLAAGTLATLLLLRSAHGGPVALTLRPGASTALVIDRDETSAALEALRRGLLMALACGALLCAAVAVTWYGPARPDPQPQLRVIAPQLSVCGRVLSVTPEWLTIESSAGAIRVAPNEIVGLQPVTRCP